MGFIKLKSGAAASHKTTGEAILKVINSKGKGSERAKFKANPKKWLFDHGYVFADEETGQAIGSGKIPAKLKLKIVEDKAKTMHVRIPFADDVPAGLEPADEVYGGDFAVFMARYFMRKCR